MHHCQMLHYYECCKSRVSQYFVLLFLYLGKETFRNISKMCTVCLFVCLFCFVFVLFCFFFLLFLFCFLFFLFCFFFFCFVFILPNHALSVTYCQETIGYVTEIRNFRQFVVFSSLALSNKQVPLDTVYLQSKQEITYYVTYY